MIRGWLQALQHAEPCLQRNSFLRPYLSHLVAPVGEVLHAQLHQASLGNIKWGASLSSILLRRCWVERHLQIVFA